MATMNISLPDEMKAWVENQVGAKYGNTSDFVRDLFRKEQERQAYSAWMNSEIEKGLASENVEMTVEEAFAYVNARAAKMREKKDVA
jgi:antitoxin ParD1/3/4